MKNAIIVFILLTIFLYGCENDVETPDVSGDEASSISDLSNEVKFIESEWANKEDWDQIEFAIDLREIEFPIKIKRISTKEDSIDIGRMILANCKKNNIFGDIELKAVVHYTYENIWLFEYSMEQLLPCSVSYVAIDGNNCEIIKAWVEE